MSRHEIPHMNFICLDNYLLQRGQIKHGHDNLLIARLKSNLIRLFCLLPLFKFKASLGSLYFHLYHYFDQNKVSKWYHYNPIHRIKICWYEYIVFSITLNQKNYWLTSFEWVLFWCFARSEALLNAFEHPGNSQVYGFSPVWDHKCVFRFSSLEYALLHISNY